MNLRKVHTNKTQNKNANKNLFSEKAMHDFSFNRLKTAILSICRKHQKHNHTKMQFQQSCCNKFSLVYNAFLSNTFGRHLLKKKLWIMTIYWYIRLTHSYAFGNFFSSLLSKKRHFSNQFLKVIFFQLFQNRWQPCVVILLCTYFFKVVTLPTRLPKIHKNVFQPFKSNLFHGFVMKSSIF